MYPSFVKEALAAIVVIPAEEGSNVVQHLERWYGGN